MDDAQIEASALGLGWPAKEFVNLCSGLPR